MRVKKENKVNKKVAAKGSFPFFPYAAALPLSRQALKLDFWHPLREGGGFFQEHRQNRTKLSTLKIRSLGTDLDSNI